MGYFQNRAWNRIRALSILVVINNIIIITNDIVITTWIFYFERFRKSFRKDSQEISGGRGKEERKKIKGSQLKYQRVKIFFEEARSNFESQQEKVQEKRGREKSLVNALLCSIREGQCSAPFLQYFKAVDIAFKNWLILNRTERKVTLNPN